MPLDVWGLIGRRTGDRNIALAEGKGFWSLHIYAMCDFAICDQIASRNSMADGKGRMFTHAICDRGIA